MRRDDTRGTVYPYESSTVHDCRPFPDLVDLERSVQSILHHQSAIARITYGGCQLQNQPNPRKKIWATL